MVGNAMPVSRPLRLVAQAAQSIEFSCPLCAGVHAAYVFGTSKFKIYRCAGCALTFCNNRFLSKKLPCPDKAAIFRSEEQYGELVSALDTESVKGPILVVTDPGNGIISAIERRRIAIGHVA